MARLRRNEAIAYFEARWSKAKESYRTEAVAALTAAYDRFHAEELADRHFDEHLLSDSTFQSEARMGELLFAMLLWQSDFTLSSANAGPDFRAAKEGLTICFEVITPEPKGFPEGYLDPPKAGEDVARRVPHEQRVLRWTHALKTKSDKWIGEDGAPGWLTKGVVNEREPYVIVINSVLLDRYWFDINGISTLPYPVEICYGVGPIAAAIDPLTGNVLSEGNQFRPAIKRTDRDPVPSSAFLSTGYDHVSAVLGCILKEQAIVFGKEPLAELVHNNRASVVIPPNVVPATREWIGQDEVGHIAITPIRGSLAPHLEDPNLTETPDT
ncbi:hypothetical protein ACPPVV_00570 [Rhodanobacter sp. Col0626]|uniref:hypothetical protein n=1 Tax=Rhodanobacter sp. Col0626 TaxID=3415679 RepID=UPI003CF0E59E